MYSLRSVSIGYEHEGKAVGTNLSAEMKRGEMTCLIGPNGAGKSTLLRTLAGFQPPLSGEVMVENKCLKEYSAQELSKMVSVVLTDNNHIKHLSVYDAVSMGRSPYTGFWGKLNVQDKKIIDESIETVGMSAFKDRMMETLSDGERQKVMIAKALAQDTLVILLDEPTSFLYYKDKIDMMSLLRRLAHDKGKSILLSTHEIDIALEVADKIWYLSEGQLITGSPQELCDNKINELSYEKIVDCIDAINQHLYVCTTNKC